MYQDACDGILDRPRDVALERSAAVMWCFDPMQMGQELNYVELEDEFDVMHLQKSKCCGATFCVRNNLTLIKHLEEL